MKDDIDNNKLNQPDSDMDMETPTIPGETEPDTTNTNDNMSDPYAAPTSSIDGIKSTDEDNGDAASVNESPVTDEPDNTDKVYDPIGDFNPSDESTPTSETQDNIGSPSSTTMPDFVAPAPVVETKKSKRSKIILGFMVFVLLLALGGFVYWYYYMQPSTDNNTTPVATEPVETKTSLSYTDVIKDLKSEMPTLVADSFPNVKTTVVDDVAAPVYKATSDDFYISAKGDTQTLLVQSDADKKYSYEDDGIDVNDKYIEANKPIADAAIKYLTDNDFKEAQTADRDLPLAPSIYVNDITVCLVSSNEDPASVSCTELANYTKDRETLKPVFATLKKAEKDIGENTILGIETTKTNEKLGYENIVVGIGDVRAVTGGYAGLLYKQTDSKTWAFLAGTQGPLACDKYDTYAKQAAFEGDPCGDGKTVTVTADKPKKMKAL